jgi:hypothetical protein
MVPDSALAGRTVKAKANNPNNNKVTIRLETILFKFSAFFGIILAWFANKTFETTRNSQSRHTRAPKAQFHAPGADIFKSGSIG